MDAAIAQAAHGALLWLYPSQHERLAARLAEDLALIPDGTAKEQGIELGHRAAAASRRLLSTARSMQPRSMT